MAGRIPPKGRRRARAARARALVWTLAGTLVWTLAGTPPGTGASPHAARAAEAGAPAPTFLGELEDVPLMPGLTEDESAGVAFETAAGRIVDAVASGPAGGDLDRAAVLDFYAATLPALGWRATGPRRYERGGEVLTLAVGTRDARIVVRYAVRPR